jgi:hypothetical protein
VVASWAFDLVDLMVEQMVIAAVDEMEWNWVLSVGQL